MQKPIVRIEGWQYWEDSSPFFGRAKVLTGQAFGHTSPYISDSEPVTTSQIVGLREGYVETQNTLYELGEWKGEGPNKAALFAKLRGAKA